MGQKPKWSGLHGEGRGRSGGASMDISFKKFFWEGEQRWVRLFKAGSHVSRFTC